MHIVTGIIACVFLYLVFYVHHSDLEVAFISLLILYIRFQVLQSLCVILNCSSSLGFLSTPKFEKAKHDL